MSDTKAKILKVAERMLIQHGADKVTMRMITAEAGVNLAAINYHFGSKAELENALLARFIGPIDEKRLMMLDEAEKLAGPAGPPLEKVLECFLIPLIEFGKQYPNHHHLFISLYRFFNDETRFKAQIQKIMVLTMRRFAEALIRSLPGVPRKTVFARITFMWSTATALLDNWLLDDAAFATLGLDTSKMDILQEMVAFLAAGFRDPGQSTPV